MLVERLVRFVVNNRLFTLIFAFIILLAAWIRLPELTIKQNPTVELPTLMITAALPGASAKEIGAVWEYISDKLMRLEDNNNLPDPADMNRTVTNLSAMRPKSAAFGRRSVNA